LTEHCIDEISSIFKAFRSGKLTKISEDGFFKVIGNYEIDRDIYSLAPNKFINIDNSFSMSADKNLAKQKELATKLIELDKEQEKNKPVFNENIEWYFKEYIKW